MWKRKGGCMGIQMVTFLFLISKGAVMSTVYRIDVDRKVNVPEGMCLIIPCKFTADNAQEFTNSQGLWIQQKGFPVNLGMKKNFHVVGDSNKGNCTLKITDAQKHDSGIYYFRFEQCIGRLISFNYLNALEVVVTDIREIPGYSIQVAQEVTVRKGHCVTIPCSFTSNHMRSFSNIKGYWRTSCHAFVATNDKSITPVKENFVLKGDLDHGDCTWMITNAQEEDAGQYYFHKVDGNGGNKFSFYSKLVTVQVQVSELEDKPQILDPGVLTEGEEVTITCTAPTECADAQYTWGNSSGLWATTSKVTFVPTRNHHQTTLTCDTTFPFWKHNTRTEIRLFVHYSPYITISINTSETKNLTPHMVTVKEGDTLELKCSVDSNPGAEVIWMKGNKTEVTKGLGSELILHLPNITSGGNGTYYCLVRNKIGTTVQAIHIIVEYSSWAGMAVGITITILVLTGLGVFLLIRHRNKLHFVNASRRIKREQKKTEEPDQDYENPEEPNSNINSIS